jgi:hypothetical protein
VFILDLVVIVIVIGPGRLDDDELAFRRRSW